MEERKKRVRAVALWGLALAFLVGAFAGSALFMFSGGVSKEPAEVENVQVMDAQTEQLRKLSTFSPSCIEWENRTGYISPCSGMQERCTEHCAGKNQSRRNYTLESSWGSQTIWMPNECERACDQAEGWGDPSSCQVFEYNETVCVRETLTRPVFSKRPR